MLYIVSTPIGNLKDITLRALEVLKEADVIACEDTRHSLKLLNHYEIKKPLISYHKFNETASGEGIVKLLKEGKTVALITDAGTPIVSDPGNVLVNMLKKENLAFTCVPGACAFLPALILSGLNPNRFTFIGFLPSEKREVEKLLDSVKDNTETLIFYSAPHDVKKDVQTLYKYLGERKAVAVREITKVYEESVSFNLSDGIDGDVKGEYVLVIEGASEKENPLNGLSEEEHIKHYIDEGYSKMDALKKTAKDRGVSKSSLYKYTL